MTPTQRTLKWLRLEGWHADIVERWLPIPGIPGGGKRRDFINCIDIIAFKENKIMGVQSCGQAFSEHRKKILAEPMAREWLKAGGKLTLIGWRKLKKQRGGKQKIWTPRIDEITPDDFSTPSPIAPFADL